MSDCPDGTLALARCAAEAIRSLNHATLGGDGLDQPADAYAGPRRAVPGRLPAPAAAGPGRHLARRGAGRRAARLRRRHRPGRRRQRRLAVHRRRPRQRSRPRPRPPTGPAAARRRQRQPVTEGPALMIDAVIDRFGLTRMPFGRDLPPGRLHRHADCAEAAARITWAVTSRTIGVITGEVGTGKTAAIRAAVAGLTPPATTSSTSATPPPGSAASSPASSPRSADGPPTAPPPWPSRPGTSWPARPPNEDGPRS